MKKLFALIVLLALAVIFLPFFQPNVDANQHQAVFGIDRNTYIGDGDSILMDVAPFTQDGRIYVPARYLGNALGIPDDKIVWDENSQMVTFLADAATIRLVVGSNLLLVGDEERLMDAAPLDVEGRVFIPARPLAEALNYEVQWDEASQSILIGAPDNLPQPPAQAEVGLPMVGSYENLISMLAALPEEGLYGWRDAWLSSGVTADGIRLKASSNMDMAMNAQPEAQSIEAGAGTGAADYSGTNVQVEGVDEADIVKTDGSYIYLVSGQRVVVAKAYPAEDMQITASLDFTGNKSFSPLEMYVDGQDMIVIGYVDKYAAGPQPYIDIYPPAYYRSTVKAIIYDISDKANIKQVRELELEGSYVSSRKIGNAFYLLANKGIYYNPLARTVEEPRPVYRDTAAGGEYTEIDYSQIRCFPDFSRPNYLIVAGVNLQRPEEKADISTYLGSGDNIYASMENLYVAVSEYKYEVPENSDIMILPGSSGFSTSKTKIYKFALNDGKLSYNASGEVPGIVLNQFSMDEYNNCFRIATTSGDIWRNDEYTSKNNLYTLDSGLNILGRLEGIAPGEKIYSVRFIGSRGYMVTFKTVDPFFVIDLKEPSRPAILGALKIPGYSDYMHPYDENHIIGFGKETIEIGQKGDGATGDTAAYYTGMKMAIFDVTEVSNPVEMYKETIGDRGTYSELLNNHKALLFAKDKNLLAFPVSVMEVQGDKVQDGYPVYGEFVYQGAYIYNIDLTDGFLLKGRITHLLDEDYQKSGNYWYDSDKNVERILYIGDVLYTLSGKYIKASNLQGLTEIGTLEIK